MASAAMTRAFTLAQNGNIEELKAMLADGAIAVNDARPDGMFKVRAAKDDCQILCPCIRAFSAS